MTITITLEDDNNGQVQVEEVRHLSAGEHELTAASDLAEEKLSLLGGLGDTETILEAPG